MKDILAYRNELQAKLNTVNQIIAEMGIGGRVVKTKSNGDRKKRRKKMSAAGRAKIAAAQKARWAKIKKDH